MKHLVGGLNTLETDQNVQGIDQIHWEEDQVIKEPDRKFWREP